MTQATCNCLCDMGYVMSEPEVEGASLDDFRQRFIEKYNEQQDAGK